MSNQIRFSFLALVVLQAIHSTEEFFFGFYERFPPMRVLYESAPQLAKPAFAFFNSFLVLAGLISFLYWVRSGRKGARAVVWLWIVIESFNVMAHLVWALSIGGYNPGLVTGVLFVPLLTYLVYLMKSSSPYAGAQEIDRGIW